MKHWFLACTLALALGVAPSAAHAGPIGVGVIAGEPTGISLKFWTDRVHAVDAAIGWSLSGDSSVQLHADYLWHNFGLVRPSGVEGRFPVYYGVGARLDTGHEHQGHDTDERFGVRVPIGIAWVATSAPIDVFVEIVPVLDLIPDTDLGVGAAIGVRFWFR